MFEINKSLRTDFLGKPLRGKAGKSGTVSCRNLGTVEQLVSKKVTSCPTASQEGIISSASN